jgi:hypothetical protein
MPNNEATTAESPGRRLDAAHRAPERLASRCRASVRSRSSDVAFAAVPELHTQRNVYFATLCAASRSAFLMTPTAYPARWRR